MVRNRPTLVLGATVTLVAALLVAPVGVPRALPGADAAGPVSGAIGLGGGLSGSVDQRTGLFSVSVPVASVGGPGSAGVTWSLVWDQARAADSLDRSGFGPGWSLGVSFINTAAPPTVYPANGGAYVAGGTFPSGLRDYPQQDLVFKESPESATPFTLSYDDGRVDSFNRDGNLVTRADRFGNHTQLTWEHPPGNAGVGAESIVDGYGQTTTFTYSACVRSGVGSTAFGRDGRQDHDHVGPEPWGDVGDRPEQREDIVRVFASGRRIRCSRRWCHRRRPTP